MSDYDAEPLPEPEPVTSANEAESAEASDAEEEAEASEAEASEAVEPVEEEESDPVEEEESAPVEEEEESAPVEEEEPANEVEEESPVEEEAEVEEPGVVEEPARVELVVSDIREILIPVESANEVEVSSPEVVNDNICSLKTLVDVLRKWSGNEVRGRQIEDLLKDGTDVDESLDDIEKVVEIVHSWVKEGGRKRDATKNLSNINGYELLGESKNLSEEEKVESLKRLTELVINLHN